MRRFKRHLLRPKRLRKVFRRLRKCNFRRHHSKKNQNVQKEKKEKHVELQKEKQ